MGTRVFVEKPKAVLEMVKLLVWYFWESDEQEAIGSASLHRACRLLKVMARGHRWIRSGTWKERLELAGIDPVTLQVIDEHRWALTWEQLTRTRTFKDDVQRQRLAVGYEPKERKADTVIKARKLPERRVRHSQDGDGGKADSQGTVNGDYLPVSEIRLPRRKGGKQKII